MFLAPVTSSVRAVCSRLQTKMSRTPTSIFTDGTTLKSDMQKYPKGKFEKNNVKTLNKLEKKLKRNCNKMHAQLAEKN